MGGISTVVGMVNGMPKELNITVPVALHLTMVRRRCKKNASKKVSPPLCSMVPNTALKKNIEKQKEIVALARKKASL